MNTVQGITVVCYIKKNLVKIIFTQISITENDVYSQNYLSKLKGSVSQNRR